MQLWVKITILNFFVCNLVSAQTTFFSENVGTPAATTAITSYTGWQNNGILTFTGSGDVRTSTASSGYAGASGSGNVFLTNTIGKNFQISSINTSSCASFTLSFGVFKSTTTSNGSELLVEVSTDGTTYTALTMPALPTGAGTATWYLVTITTGIPATANLRIRFTNNSTGPQFRIDDVILSGSCSNSITTGAVSPTSYTVDCTTGSAGTVAFTSTGTFNAGNVYTAQLSDVNGSFASPVNIGTLASTANSGTINITIPANTIGGSLYQIQVIASDPATIGSVSAAFTVYLSCYCPTMTGAILNSCNLGCNEGDAEIMLFNSGTFTLTVASLPAHTIDYFGNTANFTAGTINAFTGTASSNAATTAALNASSGCSGSFIDANTAGTIPPWATFIMVPSSFCYTNYDFSNICAAYGPIYVVYFGTGGWNTSGNLANYQAGTNPKYLTADFSWAGASCGKQYYTFDAGLEYSGGTGGGDGASIAFPGSISTASASPTSPNFYSGSGACALPTTLPINLLEFKAEALDASTSKLNFVTSEESHVKQYIISKSVNGYSYSVIDREISLNRQAKTNYVLYDRIDRESGSVIYYRLEEEDFNGVKKTVANCFLNLKTSREIIVSSNGSGLLISMPVTAKSIEILSLDGKSISYLEGNGNDLVYQVDLESFPKGFYLLKITDADDKITVKKIIH